MKSKIILLLDSMGRYPQKLHETEGLDINKLTNHLNMMGFELYKMTYNDFLSDISNIDCSQYLFLYASSQYEAYKDYMEDILLYIVRNGGKIIPNFHLFKSHENKSYQELYKVQEKISSPNFNIIGTYEEGVEVLSKTKFPIIGKTVNGFGSKGVVQINSIKEGKRFLKKNLFSGIDFNANGLRVLGRRLKYKKQYPKKWGKLVFQEKINDVNHDWKILVFGDLFFCLKRSVRKNDFRASGSGIFDFNAIPPDNILKFADEIRDRLDTPWASLDIIIQGDDCYLIEYQALHFGLATLINNKFYYKFDNNTKTWIRCTKDSESEYYFSVALKQYLSNNVNRTVRDR